MTELLRDQVADLIVAGLHAAQEKGALPQFETIPVVVERPRQIEHGDYASPVCLQLASAARMSPRQIAAQVVEHIPPAPFVEKIEVAGPGYINLTLSVAWLASQVNAILAAGATFGNLEIGQGQRYQVEFVSANPTGPLHVGSVRNAVIGDVLANVLAAAGFEVEREYYVNDAGSSQVRHFGESVYARYAQALGRDEPFPEDGYRGQYIVEMGEQVAQQYGDRYLNLPRQEAVRALGSESIERVLAEMRRDLAGLGVEFDAWFHEKSLYESGLFDRVLHIAGQGMYRGAG